MKNHLPVIRWLAVVLMMPAVMLSGAETEEKETVQSVSFKGGILVATIDGKETEATNEIAFPKEVVIGTNGVFTVAGGKERTLAEGQVLGRDGTLTSPDGSIVPVEDHLVGKGGRVLLVKDGEARPLTAMHLLKNGTRVHPDGRMVTPRNSIKRLLDGQILRLDENGAVESTDTAQLEKGKVILFKDGARIELRAGQVMAMSDGSRVNGSGFVIRKNGSRVALKEGELFKFAGAGDTR